MVKLFIRPVVLIQLGNSEFGTWDSGCRCGRYSHGRNCSLDLGLYVGRLSEGLNDSLVKVIVVLNELVEDLKKGGVGVRVKWWALPGHRGFTGGSHWGLILMSWSPNPVWTASINR